MKRSKILLVGDNCQQLKEKLREANCEIVPVVGIPAALGQILSGNFDAIVTDLDTTAIDNIALITAMRHAQPKALTVMITGPDSAPPAIASLDQIADEVIRRPIDVQDTSALIANKATGRCSVTDYKENVASVLERDAALTIERWLARVHLTEDLVRVPVCDDDRIRFLPTLLSTIVARLRELRVIEAIRHDSPAASAHGRSRYAQGYTAPLMVEESRLLQVSIFETIHRNLAFLDFSSVLPDVMLIADEVDSQLKQSIGSFLAIAKEASAA
jgi:CheY-like chemotaxis protein